MLEKVLVANRGEIALRVFRTCRRLGVRTVAVYSDADRDALHTRSADERVRIGPARATASYLSIPAIIEAARATAADAIHPGYGFLSENADFAEACAAAGIVFIGPPPAAMRALGDKAAARRLAVASGVPVLPGSASGEHDTQALLAAAEAIGFPLMVKAAAGGGGRGMRLVRERGELQEALEAAGREAAAAFGDARLLLERAVVGGRHVEVQVLADAHGGAVHLGERDCSIQRRYQKVIEESPSPAVDQALRARLGEAALRITRAAGYQNAGTVEFLLDRGGEFSFLEMNTRLQVEHGVTELISGHDLVALQLRIAAGEPIGFAQDEVTLSGHAIECRIYAEQPARDYLPSSGRLDYFAPPAGAGVRNDVGVETGSVVSTAYDPLLAKLMAHGASRAAAIERCQRALAAYAVDGVQTNLGLLAAVLRHPPFVAGAADLSTLATLAPATPATAASLPAEELSPRLGNEALAAAAVASLLPRHSTAAIDAWDALGAWRGDGTVALSYGYQGRSFAVAGNRLPGRQRRWRLSFGVVGESGALGGSEHEVEAEGCLDAAGTVVVSFGGERRRWSLYRHGPRLVLESEEGSRYTLLEGGAQEASRRATVAAGAASSLVSAPTPGTIVRVLVEAGQRVRARQPLVILEAMKMEHVLEAPADAAVSRLMCRAGDAVAEGQLLIELTIGDQVDR